MSNDSPVLDPERLRKAIQKQMAAFFSQEPAVLAGTDPEAVHDMRVASRRLQEILKVVVPDGGGRRKLFRQIRRVRRMQADVRDLDVMAESLRKLRRRSSARARCEGLDLLISTLIRRRERALALLRTSLTGARLSRLENRLYLTTEAALTPPLDGGAVISAVTASTRQREQEFQLAAAQARKSGSVDDLHAARIAGKRIRYILEVANALRIGSPRPRIRELKSIQRGLGDWHDIEVLEEVLIRFCCSRKRAREHTEAVRSLYDLVLRNRQLKSRHLQGFMEGAGETPSSGAA